MHEAPARPLLPIVVLLSGKGTNLQAILDRIGSGRLDAELRAVISDRQEAEGLDRARRAGVATRVVDPSAAVDRAAFGENLSRQIDIYAPRLIILAGFMRILDPATVARFEGRMINVHPSLLPRYRGLSTYRRVLAAGDPVHGSSVHFVTRDLDSGPVIAQVPVPVRAGDTAETLQARVQECEHIMLPTVIEWFARGRVQFDRGRILMDGRELEQPIVFDA